jgi:hypothetical protein
MSHKGIHGGEILTTGGNVKPTNFPITASTKYNECLALRVEASRVYSQVLDSLGVALERIKSLSAGDVEN